MQLTGKASIRGALTVLTATLLGSGAVQAVDENQLESSILLYSETDRVNAAEGIVSYSRAIKGNRILNARLTFDALTGASPSGATPSGEIQTYTRPSGNGTYTVTAGEIPLDDTFRDTRFSFDAGLTQPLNRETSLVFGTHVSGEHDYFSLGGNIGFTRDFKPAQHHTFSLGGLFTRCYPARGWRARTAGLNGRHTARRQRVKTGR